VKALGLLQAGDATKKCDLGALKERRSAQVSGSSRGSTSHGRWTTRLEGTGDTGAGRKVIDTRFNKKGRDRLRGKDTLISGKDLVHHFRGLLVPRGR